MNESWIYQFTLEHNNSWSSGDPRKKVMSKTFAVKEIASVFLGTKIILLIVYVEKSKTITGGYYSYLLVQLD